MILADILRVRIGRIIWHIEANRDVLGDKRTLDDVLRSLKSLEDELNGR